jgi:hypothetical protein
VFSFRPLLRVSLRGRAFPSMHHVHFLFHSFCKISERPLGSSIGDTAWLNTQIPLFARTPILTYNGGDVTWESLFHAEVALRHSMNWSVCVGVEVPPFVFFFHVSTLFPAVFLFSAAFVVPPLPLYLHRSSRTHQLRVFGVSLLPFCFPGPPLEVLSLHTSPPSYTSVHNKQAETDTREATNAAFSSTILIVPRFFSSYCPCYSFSF